jgi:TatD DNase family protein
MRFIDTHAHIHHTQFDDDRAQIFERAAANNIERFFEIGYDLTSSHAAIALAEAHEQVFAVVGIQPNYAHETDDSTIEQIRELAKHPKVVAIGEIGLDYYHDRAPHDLQERIFREQLALAREIGKPVVIHTREAKEDTIRVLQDAARGQPGVMHSFSGDWEFAEACLEVGFVLSFSGPVTFPKAIELHDVARRAPLGSILTETDSPYLSPHPRRGRRNEPANVRLVAERIAFLRDMPVADLAEAVWQNASRLFGLDR